MFTDPASMLGKQKSCTLRGWRKAWQMEMYSSRMSVDISEKKVVVDGGVQEECTECMSHLAFAEMEKGGGNW